MNGGGSEIFVRMTYIDSIPFFLCACVIYVGEAFAPIKRLGANDGYTNRYNYAYEILAIAKGKFAYTYNGIW